MNFLTQKTLQDILTEAEINIHILEDDFFNPEEDYLSEQTPINISSLKNNIQQALEILTTINNNNNEVKKWEI